MDEKLTVMFSEKWRQEEFVIEWSERQTLMKIAKWFRNSAKRVQM
jgi:hypothetical protein